VGVGVVGGVGWCGGCGVWGGCWLVVGGVGGHVCVCVYVCVCTCEETCGSGLDSVKAPAK